MGTRDGQLGLRSSITLPSKTDRRVMARARQYNGGSRRWRSRQHSDKSHAPGEMDDPHGERVHFNAWDENRCYDDIASRQASQILVICYENFTYGA